MRHHPCPHCLTGLALIAASLILVGCERESTPATPAAPERVAERADLAGTSTPASSKTDAERRVVLHVTGMMKSKGGAT